ncbi:MAG: aminotransferase class I/II-fold pyridoxal phosphate-dependent enzyme [Anaerolineaceae bacterium]|nr:aminotransferase class I/II-fold pyridoxal phosphate-dependent enzyme [Anaerolineaceae bacterium]
MTTLAPTAQNMPRSGIRMIMDMALNDPEAIHLEIGQPNFPTPAHISQAAWEAIQQGFTAYTPSMGFWSLREAVTEKLKRDNGIQARAENVIITTGGMGGVASAIKTVAQTGDEILIPDPGYPNYEMLAILNGIEYQRYPLLVEENFQPDFDRLETLVTPRTRAIIINSPSNPTGAVLSQTSVEKILDLAERHGLFVLSDECYDQITFESEHVPPHRLSNHERIISIFSFSKTYSMTGWRIGFTLSTKETADVIGKMQEALVCCASSVSQKAAEAACLGPQDCVREMSAAYRARRDACLDILRANGFYQYTPQGAFYLLVNISQSGMDSYTFAKTLLKEEHVAVAPGSTFGRLSDDFVRVSLASSMENLQVGLERMCCFIQRGA